MRNLKLAALLFICIGTAFGRNSPASLIKDASPEQATQINTSIEGSPELVAYLKSMSSPISITVVTDPDPKSGLSAYTRGHELFVTGKLLSYLKKARPFDNAPRETIFPDLTLYVIAHLACHAKGEGRPALTVASKELFVKGMSELEARCTIFASNVVTKRAIAQNHGAQLTIPQQGELILQNPFRGSILAAMDANPKLESSPDGTIVPNTSNVEILAKAVLSTRMGALE